MYIYFQNATFMLQNLKYNFLLPFNYAKPTPVTVQYKA